MKSSAIISPCGLYRYGLTRKWGDGPRVCFVMVNPSTADAEQDDPTIRRCIGFAQREGGGSLEVVNLFALRATDPKALRKHPDPIGPGNNAALRTAFDRAGRIIAAWGAHGRLHARDVTVARMLGDKAMCLGVTARGDPRHPLYLPADAPLIVWSAPR
jgi:hypothetical protein